MFGVLGILLDKALSGIVGFLIGFAGDRFIGYPRKAMLLVRPWLFIHSAKKVRVSCSVLVAMRHGEGYLLKRGSFRSESFEPFGGVRHVYGTGVDELRRMGFEAQYHEGKELSDSVADLRGLLPRENAAGFASWLFESRFVEEPVAAAARELVEELEEIGYSGGWPPEEELAFLKARNVVQYPWETGNKNDPVIRFFTVVEPYCPDGFLDGFVDGLLAQMGQNGDVVCSSVAEIHDGRVSKTGAAISNHSELLIGDKMTRADRAPGQFLLVEG